MTNGQQAPQPPQAPQSPAPQQPASQGEGTSEEKALGAICYIPIVGLVMYFVKKDSSFVLFHAKQGLVMSIIWVAIWILSAVLFWWLWFLGWIWYLLEVVVGILALVGFIQALMGKRWKVPLVSSFAEKIGQNGGAQTGGPTPPPAK